MKLSQFRFDLPLNLIAQNPAKKREDARMMVIHRHTGQIENKHFRDIMDYFDDKDVFVVNNTKVFPARMYGRKEKTGAKIEVFLLRELNKPNRLWDVIVDPARKIRVGNKLYFGDNEELVAEVIDNTTSRGRTIRFLWEDSEESFRGMLEKLGWLHGLNLFFCLPAFESPGIFCCDAPFIVPNLDLAFARLVIEFH